MLLQIVCIVSLQVLLTTSDESGSQYPPYDCNEKFLDYHYRIKKCSIDRWSQPKDVKLMPTCCMLYELACIKNILVSLLNNNTIINYLGFYAMSSHIYHRSANYANCPAILMITSKPCMSTRTLSVRPSIRQ
jgi:hypothetical protein